MLPSAAFSASRSIMQRYVSNILMHPDKQMFRSISLLNGPFVAKVARHSPALRFMELVGFQNKQTAQAGRCLVLPSDVKGATLIQALKALENFRPRHPQNEAETTQAPNSRPDSGKSSRKAVANGSKQNRLVGQRQREGDADLPSKQNGQGVPGRRTPSVGPQLVCTACTYENLFDAVNCLMCEHTLEAPTAAPAPSPSNPRLQFPPAHTPIRGHEEFPADVCLPVPSSPGKGNSGSHSMAQDGDWELVEAPPPWKCEWCTLLNKGTSDCCAVCSKPQQTPELAAGEWPCGLCTSLNQRASANEPRACFVCGVAQWLCGTCNVGSPLSALVCSRCHAPQDNKRTVGRGAVPERAIQRLSVDLAEEESRLVALWQEEDAAARVQREATMQRQLLKQAHECLDEILATCLDTDLPFVDPDFPVTQASLYGDQLEGDNLAWLRGPVILSKQKKPPSVISLTGIRSEDIEQGALGDCWFLSALSVLAERPALLEDVLLTKTVNAAGVYMLRLCVNGHWRVVIVDDHFPVNKYGDFAYSRAKGSQLWVPLLEKAYAKLFGSYAAIASGQLDEAFRDLTGAPTERLDLMGKSFAKEEAWARLLSYRQSGLLMGAACGRNDIGRNGYRAVGLRPDHAYSILDVVMCDVASDRKQGERRGEEGADGACVRLLKLRNPWGTYEWNGDWSDACPKWTPGFKQRMNMEESDDGIFWISWEDFLKYFRSVSVCMARQDWHAVRSTTQFGDGFGSSHMFEIHVPQATMLYATLLQPSHRGVATLEGAAQPLYSDLGLLITRKDGFCLEAQLPSCRQAVTCDTVLRKGVYLAMPIAFLPRRKGVPLVLSLYSTHGVIMRRVPMSLPMLRCGAQVAATTRGEEQRILQSQGVSLILTKGTVLWFTLVNRHPTKYFSITLDLSESVGLTSSRQSLVTKDVVPPFHWQILAVVSLEGPSGISIWKVRHLQSVYLDPVHEPPVSDSDFHYPIALGQANS